MGKDSKHKAESTKHPARSPDDHHYQHLILGRSPFDMWRVAFFALMAYNWSNLYHGPFSDPWIKATTYGHAEWVYDMAPMTPEAAQKLRWFGVVIALLSTFNDAATIMFAALTGQYIFTSVTNFVNHDYLFFLLSTLMALHCNSGKHSIHGKAGWVHALRGQIVVVYAFASLWKIHPDWMDGTIVRDIFLSFEEQGVARGVPWGDIYATFPNVFALIALSGLLLDTMLFSALLFLPPGHKLQLVALVFHGFTGFTMSQRIGYAFPIAMILAGLLFQPMEVVEKDRESAGSDTQCHAKWLAGQARSFASSTNTERSKGAVNKRHILPMLWLVGQWLLPLRMPIVSRLAFKHTMEGYRWSWTMMLHSKSNFRSPGLSFMTLRPRCDGAIFPNPLAQQSPFSDVQSFPYEQMLGQASVRGLVVAQMFPRQMPKIANVVHDLIKPMCINGSVSITTSYFSSTNGGPYHRIIDPNVDLFQAYRAHSSLSWLSKLWLATIDKAPMGHEHVLRGIGSNKLPSGFSGVDGMMVIIDRSECLQADPIRIHNVDFQIQFDSDALSRFPLTLTACSDLKLQECKEVTLHKGNAISVPAIRTLSIGIDSRAPIGTTCSESKEDVVIRLKILPRTGNKDRK